MPRIKIFGALWAGKLQNEKCKESCGTPVAWFGGKEPSMELCSTGCKGINIPLTTAYARASEASFWIPSRLHGHIGLIQMSQNVEPKWSLKGDVTLYCRNKRRLNIQEQEWIIEPSAPYI